MLAKLYLGDALLNIVAVGKNALLAHTSMRVAQL
jgi:hypothetical protein